MRTRTRAELRTMARQRSDQPVAGFWTDANVDIEIDQSVAQLWGMLANADPDRFLKTQSISTTTGTKAYALADDFYKVRAVDLLIGTNRFTIHPYELGERNDYRWDQIFTLPDGSAGAHYRIMRGLKDGVNEEIEFEPDPGTQTYEVHYIQAPQDFTAGAGGDAEVLDGIAGFEDWIVYDVAAKMLAKEESFEAANFMLQQRGAAELRLKHLAADRDAGYAPQIQRSRRNASRWNR